MRTKVTVDDLVTTSEQLRSIAMTLDESVRHLRESGNDSVNTHASTAVHTYLPKLFSWSMKVLGDAATLARNFQLGEASVAAAVPEVAEKPKKRVTKGAKK